MTDAEKIGYVRPVNGAERRGEGAAVERRPLLALDAPETVRCTDCEGIVGTDLSHCTH